MICIWKNLLHIRIRRRFFEQVCILSNRHLTMMMADPFIYIYCISIVCWPPAHVCSVCKVASHNSNNNNNKCHARTIPSLRSISSAYRCGAGRRQRINELERPSTTKKQEKTIKTTMECYTECYVVLSLSPLGMGNLFII